MELRTGCNVKINSVDRFYYGPFGSPLRSELNISELTFHSELLELLQSDSNNTYFEFEDLPDIKPDNPYMSPFNISESPLTTNWDNYALTKFSQYMYKMQVNLSESLANVDKAFARRSDQHSKFEMVNVIGNFLAIVLACIVIFGLMNYTKFLGLFGSGLTVISPQRVDALSIPYTGLEFDIGFDPFNFFSISSNLFNIVLIAVIIIIAIKLIWFRPTRIVSNYGRGMKRPRTECGWTLILNLNFTHNKFCCKLIENLYLRVPITCLANKQLKDLRIVNPFTMWYTYESLGKLKIKLIEDVHLFAIGSNGDRSEDSWEFIRIDIDNINWDYRPYPEAFNSADNHGIAFMSLGRDKISANSRDSSV